MTTDDADSAPEPADDPTVQLRFSATEVLRHKDFAAYDPTELHLAQALMGQLRFAGRRAVVPHDRVAPRAAPRPPRDAAIVAAHVG
jgi:hypothetical protein